MRAAASATLIAFGLALTACGSTNGNGSSSEPTTQTVSLLTSSEYAAAVNDLLGVSWDKATGPGAAGITTSAQTAPGVALGYHTAAVEIARTATAPANLPALLSRVNAGCSAPAGDDGAAGAACAVAFIQQIAPLAFHGATPDAATTGGLIDVYASVSSTQAFSGGLAAVVQEVLQSPYFLYHLPAR